MIEAGDRVRLVYTDDEYTLLKPGDEGIVNAVERITCLGPPFTQIWVDWDDGSHMAMIPESGDVVVKL